MIWASSAVRSCRVRSEALGLAAPLGKGCLTAPGSQGALDTLDVLGLLTGSLAIWQGIVLLGAVFFHQLVLSGRALNCQRGEN